MSDLKAIVLEPGGKILQLVLADAGDLDYIARQAVNCVYWKPGENRNSGSRLIVHRKLWDELLAKMLQVTQEWTAGDPLDCGRHRLGRWRAQGRVARARRTVSFRME